MKKLLIIPILICLVLCLSIKGQSTSSTTNRIRSGTSLPATCQPTGTNIFFRSDTGNLYVCSSANTWSLIGGATSTVTGTGTTNQFAIFTGTNTIGNSGLSYTANIINHPSGVYQIGQLTDTYLKISINTLNQWHLQPNDLLLDTTGKVEIGDIGTGYGNNTGIRITDAADLSVRINALGQVIIGDVSSVANSTRVTIDDAAETITINKPLLVSIVGDVASANRIRTSLATPSTLADGDWWVECSGTSPTRVCSIKVRDTGATRTIGSVTF